MTTIQTQRCAKTILVSPPDYDWALRYFGGFDIYTELPAVTNIVYANVELDSLRAGGLNVNVAADGVASFLLKTTERS